MWLKAHCCLGLGHWQPTTFVKVSDPTKQLGFLQKSPYLKVLIAKEHHHCGILGKEGKSDYIVQMNGLVVCVLLSHLQHTPLSSQAREKQGKSGNVKFYSTPIGPSQIASFPWHT